MFCNQCEQASKGTGCDIQGVCGKDPQTAALQDLLVFGLKGLAVYANAARQFEATDDALDIFVVESLFTTVTNVDFDPASIAAKVRECHANQQKAKALYESAWQAKNGGAAPAIANAYLGWTPAADLAGLVKQGEEHGINTQHANEDILSTIEILIYGLKGMAAYMDHAHILGKTDEEILAFFQKALAATTDPNLGLMDFVGLCMECGRLNLKTMEILSQAHIEKYGAPTPTPVNLGTRAGKGILVSGHDLKMLEELLKQTEGKGINIYTHGEMLPAHGYPGLKKYPHLKGNYGTAWQNQQKEFDNLPGVVLYTTNCLMPPS